MKSKFQIFCAIALLSSCSNGNRWEIKGNIEGVDDGQVVVVEGNNQGYWYPLDTLQLAADGSYKYSHEAQGYPDIYRLRIGESSVYFPIDSIETIHISATAPDINRNFKLSGSPQAENLARVDSLLNSRAAANSGVFSTDSILKRELTGMILADPSGIVAYYIINKSLSGHLLFNPENRADIRVIGAVANAFNEKRPSDPRTAYLKNLYLNKRGAKGAPRQHEANEVRAFDITLYDNKGVQHSLLDATSKGNVVILNFTAYTAEESPALNLMLNKVYEKYHANGLEVFQVAFDRDEVAWREAAKNLPWITVYNGVADGDKALRDYNVGSLPAIFIFDRNGDVVERLSDASQLDAAVARRL